MSNTFKQNIKHLSCP